MLIDTHLASVTTLRQTTLRRYRVCTPGGEDRCKEQHSILRCFFASVCQGSHLGNYHVIRRDVKLDQQTSGRGSRPTKCGECKRGQATSTYLQQRHVMEPYLLTQHLREDFEAKTWKLKGFTSRPGKRATPSPGTGRERNQPAPTKHHLSELFFPPGSCIQCTIQDRRRIQGKWHQSCDSTRVDAGTTLIRKWVGGRP